MGGIIPKSIYSQIPGLNLIISGIVEIGETTGLSDKIEQGFNEKLGIKGSKKNQRKKSAARGAQTVGAAGLIGSIAYNLSRLR